MNGYFFLTCWRLQFPLISIKTFSYRFLPQRLDAAWSLFWISNGCFPVREHLSGWAGWWGREGAGLFLFLFVAGNSFMLELFLHSALRVTLELRQVGALKSCKMLLLSVRRLSTTWGVLVKVPVSASIHWLFMGCLRNLMGASSFYLTRILPVCFSGELVAHQLQ